MNPQISFLGRIIINRVKVPSFLTDYAHQRQQIRTLITKVRLKWVKNRSLDHIIDVQTDLKAACLLKDAIVRSKTGFLTSKSLEGTHKTLGLTVQTLRFIRRYPTLFREFPHPKWPSLVCFELTDLAKLLHDQEMKVFDQCQSDVVEKLCRLLMMSKTQMMPLKSLLPLKWDLGLPDHFDKKLVEKFPDHFQIVKGTNGLACLKLAKWRDEFAVSELQKMNQKVTGSDSGDGDTYREFKRGKAALEFPMSFPRGYGGQKKVKAWMDEFQKLPYISPYEDCRRIDPDSELMEKRVVGVLHEFLSLTIYKKTKRNYLRSLREELVLPQRFTRLFTRYPGIFYLSLKCKTTTVALREGYRRGKLAVPHPLARHRDKFHHVMRTGLVYRGKGIEILPQLDAWVDDPAVRKYGGEDQREEEEEEEEEIEMTDDEGEGETDDE
ncbi:OLC1v1038151C1 [Oldenlandia corymbosa var. corymbosa]|uniref:OLC1v1038151C1 n=1 Tax=Oldenlandia corymbosa var. corymbosa TaxID=529605 RepID=A0AAV1CZ94_OLDCO|nr:OLC1v1038151C1 [Oldenlandia corymbosa var. corymbosa]